jgi:hypothetical protein
MDGTSSFVVHAIADTSLSTYAMLSKEPEASRLGPSAARHRASFMAVKKPAAKKGCQEIQGCAAGEDT